MTAAGVVAGAAMTAAPTTMADAVEAATTDQQLTDI